MNKTKYFKELKAELSNIPPESVDKYIKEYRKILKEKVDSGMSEKEALETLGTVKSLARKINRDYIYKNSSDPIGDFTRKMIDIVNVIFNKFINMNHKELAMFIVNMVLIIGVILLFQIPVSIVIDMCKRLFNILPTPINRVFFSLWRFILEFAYYMLAIIAFVKVFDLKYLNKTEKPQKEVIKTNGMFSLIMTIIVFILKFVATIILFGGTIFLILLLLLIGVCLLLLLNGVTYIGFYLSVIALFIMSVLIYEILFAFVIDRRVRGKRIFISLIITFMLLGSGIGIATFEIANTEFINSPPKDLPTEYLYEELTMDSRTVFIGNISNYVIDNSISTVRVEYYYYPIASTMSTRIEKNDDKVTLGYNIERVRITKDLVYHFIKDLKNKEIYNYHIEPTIVIVSNERNIALIKANRHEYYEGEKRYSSCNFVRTYTIETMKSIKNSDYVSVVMYDPNTEVLETTTLSKRLSSSLIPGNAYEFTFKTYESYIDLDLESLFSKNEIVNIKEITNIENVRQDTSCGLFY